MKADEDPDTKTKEEGTKNKEKITSSVREIKNELKKLNAQWSDNIWLVIASTILGSLAFVTGLFVPFEGTWEHWVQTIFFIIAAGFIVLPLSYLFNQLWILLLKEE